jgi:hypothetical protein
LASCLPPMREHIRDDWLAVAGVALWAPACVIRLAARPRRLANRRQLPRQAHPGALAGLRGHGRG